MNTLNQIQENELVEIDSLRMQDKRDESEIYIYPLIELVNSKFTNRILGGGGGRGGHMTCLGRSTTSQPTSIKCS